ncbi:hypothetical protein C8R46DRAFT_1209682 [Mycena filopes]|nr:hypothetical protein C8R46DRAFT_1209682 [Mycena filopes]
MLALYYVGPKTWSDDEGPNNQEKQVQWSDLWRGDELLVPSPVYSQASEVCLLPELRDAILDHLHDDLATLTQTALVCRSWVGTSQSLLFRSITLCPPSSRTLIRSLSYPHLARLVRSLTIHFSTPTLKSIPLTLDFPRLLALEISGTPPSDAIPFVQAVAANPNLQKITLFGPILNASFLDTIFLKRSLDVGTLVLRLAASLHPHDRMLESAYEDNQRLGHPSNRLYMEHLYIPDTPDGVVEGLLGDGCRMTLERLKTLSFTLTDDHSALVNILFAAKSSIATLDIVGSWRKSRLQIYAHWSLTLETPSAFCGHPKPFTLPRLPQLRSVVVHGTVCAMETFHVLISAVCSASRLDTIVFKWGRSVINNASDLQRCWNAVEAVRAAHPRIPVHIEVPESCRSVKVQEIREHVASFHSRATVVVNYSTAPGGKVVHMCLALTSCVPFGVCLPPKPSTSSKLFSLETCVQTPL